MLSRSFFPNFGQGPFPKIAGKSPGLNKIPQIALDQIIYFIVYLSFLI